jgi:hypothetical protein
VGSGCVGAIAEGIGFLSKEETLVPDVVPTAPVAIVPFWAFSGALLDGFGCVTMVSLMESMLFCEPSRVPLEPARCCFFFFAKSYMSPNMPAKVLRRFFIVSSASSTTDDCC